MSFDIALTYRPTGHAITVNLSSDAPIAALVGPSGAGKTSLLNLIAGLARPENGRIAVGGALLFDSATGIALAPQHRRAGYVFQDNRLFPHMKVAANLAYGQANAPARERWITRGDVLELLGIEHLLDRWPATLSGGEARRVAIGRALLSAPRFLLLDEPLTSLDADRAEGILRVVERIRDELKLPILYVSHNIAEVDRLTESILRLE